MPSDATSAKQVRNTGGQWLGMAQLRRFLFRPKGVRNHGLTETPDGKSAVCQHPASIRGRHRSRLFANRVFGSYWPDRPKSPACSATSGHHADGMAGSIRRLRAHDAFVIVQHRPRIAEPHTVASGVQ